MSSNSASRHNAPIMSCLIKPTLGPAYHKALFRSRLPPSVSADTAIHTFGVAVGRFVASKPAPGTERVGVSSCRIAPSGNVLAVIIVPEAHLGAFEVLGGAFCLPGLDMPTCLSWPDHLQPQRARLINVPPSLALSDTKRLLEEGGSWLVQACAHPTDPLTNLPRLDTVEVVLLPTQKAQVLPGGLSFTSSDGRSFTLPLHPLSDLPPLAPPRQPQPGASLPAVARRTASSCLAGAWSIGGPISDPVIED